MALTNIEIVRLQTGDRVEPYFVTDEEIESYLTLYNNNIKRTTNDVYHAILFYLAANPSAYRERTGEIEVYTTDAFKAYKEALLMRISSPHLYLGPLMPYAAGISRTDVAFYKNNSDNVLVGSNLPSNANDCANVVEQLYTDPFTDITIIRD